MNETLNTGLDLNERTVVGNVGDFAKHTGALGVASTNPIPRVVAKLFHAKRDPVLILVVTQYPRRYFLANGEHFRRMTNTTPGHIGDVQQAIDTTQIDKCAVIGNVLHNARDG